MRLCQQKDSNERIPMKLSGYVFDEKAILQILLVDRDIAMRLGRS